MTTVLEVQKLISQRFAAIPENPIFASTPTVWFDAFKMEKESLSKVNKLKDELASSTKQRVHREVGETPSSL